MTELMLDAAIAGRYLKIGEKVAVALSGGADSVCLLHIAHELSKERAFTLYALHLNHMIRGDEADRDEMFVHALCDSLGVSLISERADVPALAKKDGRSLEDAAREARYSFFELAMQKEGITVLMTAHNADDNAENVLLRLARGASTDGLCGISPVREEKYGTVIRPMLHIPKSDILSYLEERGLSHVEDSTNADTDYPRNRIRKNIIPELLMINPSFLSSAAGTMSLLRADSDYLLCEADRAYDRAVTGDGLSFECLNRLPYPILSRVFVKFCHMNGSFPEKRHIDSLCEKIKAGKRFSMSLPKKKRMVFDGKIIYLSDDIREKSENNISYEFKLSVGENEYEICDGVSLKISVTSCCGGHDGDIRPISFPIEGELYSRELLYPSNDGNLTVRERRAGDIISFGDFRKDVRRLYSEKRIPVSLRSVLPIIEDGEGILTLPFIAKAKRKAFGDGYIIETRLIYGIKKQRKENNHGIH